MRMRQASACVFSPNQMNDRYVEEAGIELGAAPFRLPCQCDRRCRALRLRDGVGSALRRDHGTNPFVISGDHDTVVYSEIHSGGLVRDIPDAEIVWIPNMGHKPDWVAPELVAAAIGKGGRPRCGSGGPGWRSRGRASRQMATVRSRPVRLRDRRRQVPHPEGGRLTTDRSFRGIEGGEPSDAGSCLRSRHRRCAACSSRRGSSGEHLR